MPKKPRTQSTPEAISTDSTQGMLEAIVSLVGRLVFPPEQLAAIVIKWKKKDPEDYVKAYNLCDGDHTVSQIADEIGVTEGTLSPILTEWKELGLVYGVTKKGGKFYKKLYRLEMPKETEAAKEEKATPTLQRVAQEPPQGSDPAKFQEPGG